MNLRSLFRNPFRRRHASKEEFEMLLCHMVVLSELLEGAPNCDNLSKMAEKELYKAKVHYPEFERPSLEEAQRQIKEHATKHPELYPSQQ